MSPRPILLLSAGRSGSHLLRSFFEADPAVLSIREFLNPTPATHDARYAFWSPENPAFAARLLASRADPQTPNAVFRDYVEWLVAQAGPRSLFADMKYDNVGPIDALWRKVDEAPPPIAGFIARDAVVLHLVRRNPLAQYCSLRRAIATKEWVRTVERGDGISGESSQGIRIETEGLVERLRRVELCKTVAEYWIAEAPNRLTIAYEDLLEGDRLASSMRQAIEALSERHLDLGGRAGTVKIAPPLNQLIINGDAVRAALAGSEFEWCLDDAVKWARRSPSAGTVRRASDIRPVGGRARAVERLRDGGGRTVLLCRELPASLGAPIDLVTIAKRLAAAGYRPILALIDPQGYGDLGKFPVLPSPVWPALCSGGLSVELREYTDLLAAIGFAESSAVAGIAAAWRGIAATIRPSVIVADHSPGLVAALGAGPAPVIKVGAARTLPPLTERGYPPLLSVRRPPPPIGAMLDAMARIGRQPETWNAAGLARLLETSRRVVVGLPELDPYHYSRSEPLAAPPEAARPLTPPCETRRLLAVLPPRFGPGTPFATFLMAADPGACFLDASSDTKTLRTAIEETSHVVCLAGSVASAAALVSGRPQLMVLNGTEGDFDARLVEQQMAGRRIDIRLPGATIRARVAAFLVEAFMSEQAMLVADRIAWRRQPEAHLSHRGSCYRGRCCQSSGTGAGALADGNGTAIVVGDLDEHIEKRRADPGDRRA